MSERCGVYFVSVMIILDSAPCTLAAPYTLHSAEGGVLQLVHEETMEHLNRFSTH